MFLSVILPAYNGETYLGACLDSLLAQDLSGGEYEIICVNDGSRDSSGDIVRRYAREHANIRLIDRENGGVAAARNTGLAAARGDYIWFVDADDLVAPNCLGRLCRTAGEGDWERVSIGAYQFTNHLTQEEQTLFRQGRLPVNCPWQDAVVWRNLLKRDFLLRERLSFRYPHLTHGEDGIFMYEVSYARPRTLDLEDVLYFYRIHSGSAETCGSSANRMRRLRSHIAAARIMADYRSGGRNDTATVNKLMSLLWNTLYQSCGLPGKEARAVLTEMKQAGLFPLRKPAACTLTKAYMTQRTGPAAAAFDWLCRHLHTPWGFAAMWMIRRCIAIKKRITPAEKG